MPAGTCYRQEVTENPSGEFVGRPDFLPYCQSREWTWQKLRGSTGNIVNVWYRHFFSLVP